MPQTSYLHGSATMVPHTPGSAVTAGDVVVTATTPRIAHVDIEANRPGDLASEGGVYQGTGDAEIAVDKKLYWNNTAKKLTEDAASGANKVIGVSVSACAADGSPINFRHDPSA